MEKTLKSIVELIKSFKGFTFVEIILALIVLMAFLYIYIGKLLLQIWKVEPKIKPTSDKH